MYEDDIKELNEWFEDEERSFETGRADDEYNVDQADVDDFCDFMREQYPDLIGIPCMVGTGGIWFTKDDLEKARYL